MARGVVSTPDMPLLRSLAQRRSGCYRNAAPLELAVRRVPPCCCGTLAGPVPQLDAYRRKRMVIG